MVLNKVYLTSDAYAMCVAHAFTNEKEEIMGLLMGEINSMNKTCHISAAMILRRSDKRPDRVEISPEQLSNASNEAERLSRMLNRPMRIVGWYHSHPHITVWPSNVDIRTQASYQLMDDSFVGLIFSVFNQDKSNMNRLQVCCFQSKSLPDGRYEKVDVELQISPSSGMCQSVIESYFQLPDIILEEEKALYEKTKTTELDGASLMYNEAVYTANLVRILECVHVPLMTFMKAKLEQNKMQIDYMKEKKEHLKATFEKEMTKLSLNQQTSTIASASKADDNTGDLLSFAEPSINKPYRETMI